MTLGELLTVLDESGLRARPAAPGNGAAVPDTVVGSIAYDSRAVSPSALFVALKGAQADGSAFAGQAIAKGAAAVVAETGAPEGCPVPWITVSDGRLALALLASHFHGHPSRRMRVVGITGTNGKTTTSYLVQAAIEAAGIPCGLMGTVQYRGRQRRARRGADHARGPRRAADAARDARCRLRGVRHGGLLACARAQARRRHPLCRGGLHEPHPRPPRLPRRHGSVLRGQAAAVRAAAGRRSGRGERRRPARRRAGRRTAALA